MNESKRDRIAARAHALWEQEGRPENKSAEHWRRAEQEVAEEERAEQMGGRSEEPPAADIDTRPAPPVQAAPPYGTEEAPERAAAHPGSEKPKRRPGRTRTPRQDPQRR